MAQLVNTDYPLKAVAVCILFSFIYIFYDICTSVGINYEGDITISNQKSKRSSHERNPKYILEWAKRRGKIVYPTIKCSDNCIFTRDKGRFDGDYTKFDAIIFNEDILSTNERPIKRDPSQIYIFSTLESSYTVPACEIHDDDYFNWTFTYRLDSDIVWSYFQVRSLKGQIVAPRVSVTWKQNNHPVKKKIRYILKRKNKAAAWLVSHCRADSLRDDYLTRLQEHLFHYSLKIDVYGDCSKRKCPNNACGYMIRKDYYFYMAFENSFADDYVTEKILHGYENYAVPIVYGGANYSRFLPPGSYINAREIHPYNLAFKMYQAIKNREIYLKYFKWTNLYTITSEVKPHPLCEVCKRLHNMEGVYPARKYFRLWWNRLNGMKWCLSNEFWNETSNVNIDVRTLCKLWLRKNTATIRKVVLHGQPMRALHTPQYCLQ
ncbi:unnamed protein product [Danaus chrysippus]|uniref:Fucosyltransferase n=1 Tax=Danaus chrysippus TaxID=151541 RepID=A0A8J2QMG8_9NEOP|nr:unnamed protein product [Danaus chrysippus]